MKCLKFTNNTCTVGWSMLHAQMCPEDMEALLALCPQGSFIPTIGLYRHSSSAAFTPEIFRTYYFGREFIPMYFEFPNTHFVPVMFTVPFLQEGLRDANPFSI